MNDNREFELTIKSYIDGITKQCGIPSELSRSIMGLAIVLTPEIKESMKEGRLKKVEYLSRTLLGTFLNLHKLLGVDPTKIAEAVEIATELAALLIIEKDKPA